MGTESTTARWGLALAVAIVCGACGGRDPDHDAWLALQRLSAPPAWEQDAEARPAPVRVALRSAVTDPASPPAAPGGAAAWTPPASPIPIARADIVSVLMGREELSGIAWRQESDRGAIDCVLTGECEFALISRELSQAERQAGLQATLLAEFVLVLVVHGESPVRSLTPGQVRAVLSGQQRDWRAIGGGAAQIELVAEAAPQIEQRVAAILMAGDRLPHDASRLPGPEAVLAEVANRPHALGITDLGSLRRRRELAVRALAIDLQPPDQQLVPPPTYPWRAPLLLVHAPRAVSAATLAARLRAEALAKGRLLGR